MQKSSKLVKVVSPKHKIALNWHQLRRCDYVFLSDADYAPKPMLLG